MTNSLSAHPPYSGLSCPVRPYAHTGNFSGENYTDEHQLHIKRGSAEEAHLFPQVPSVFLERDRADRPSGSLEQPFHLWHEARCPTSAYSLSQNHARCAFGLTSDDHDVCWVHLAIRGPQALNHLFSENEIIEFASFWTEDELDPCSLAQVSDPRTSLSAQYSAKVTPPGQIGTNLTLSE